MEPTGRPTIEQLRAFSAVADGGSYSQVGGGRRQAGYQLLVRLHTALFGDGAEAPRLIAEGGAGLTVYGEELRAYVDACLHAHDALMGHARSLVENRLVSVGCPPSVVTLVDAAWSELNRSEAGGVEVVLRDVGDVHRLDLGARLVELVRTRALDLAVVPGTPQARPGTRVMPLYHWHLCVLLPLHSVAYGAGDLEACDLAALDLRLAATPQGHASRGLLDGTGVPLRIWFETSSVNALAEVVRQERAASVLSDDSLVVQWLLAAGGQVRRLTHEGRPLTEVNSLVMSDHPSMMATRFAKELMELAKSGVAAR